MEKFKSADEALDYAIAREQEAAEYYNELAQKMIQPWMADVFKSFALEETGHKNKLQKVKEGQRLVPSEKKIQDLKLAEYLVDVDETAHLGYQEALILAMKREKASFKLYSDLAVVAGSDDLCQTFLALAQEEAKHKLKIEVAYDEYILKDN